MTETIQRRRNETNAPRYVSVVFDPTRDSWDSIRDDILRIENEQFGDGAFQDDYLGHEFGDPANTAVVLRDEATSRVAGFTYAVPIGLIEWDRVLESRDTAYICDTALGAAYQGRRLIAPMMAALERELRRRGYQFLERDAAVSNGYAAKIERAYGDRIVVQGEPRDSEYGPQVFFRIRL